MKKKGNNRFVESAHFVCPDHFFLHFIYLNTKSQFKSTTYYGTFKTRGLSNVLSSSLSLKIIKTKSFFFFFFLGLHPQHTEVPRLGVKQELQLPVYTTAMQDPNRICDLHHSSQQCLILNPLSKDRDQTCILMDPSHDH